jgi:hypothetical protein
LKIRRAAVVAGSLRRVLSRCFVRGPREIQAVAAVVLVLGCTPAPAQMRIGALLDEVRQNELASLSKYRGKQMALDGVVSASGARPVEQVRAEHSYVGPWGGSSELKRSTEHHPYLYLADPEGRPYGAVLCYFDPEALEDVARVVPGTRLRVTGYFQEPSRSARGIDVVLNHCELP